MKYGKAIFHFRIIILVLTLHAIHHADAQSDHIHMAIPNNTTCTDAIPICRTTHFSYDEPVSGCLWFYFELRSTQHVHIEVPDRYVHFSTPPSGPCVCNATSFGTVVDQELSGHYIQTPVGVDVQGYFIAVDVDPEVSSFSIDVLEGVLGGCRDIPCEGCLPSFSPLPGKEYIVNAWTKEEGNELGALHYTAPRLCIQAPPGNLLLSLQPDQVDPVLVEGWQLLEGTFTMPGGGAELLVSLASADGSPVLFDDVRIFPADGSMKSYVYDRENLRFVAELDERHFATFYEYDNEGRLVRVKKETERGIRTMKETRQSSPRLTP